MPVKANEYWGRIGELMQPREPDICSSDGLARRAGLSSAHVWSSTTASSARRPRAPRRTNDALLVRREQLEQLGRRVLTVVRLGAQLADDSGVRQRLERGERLLLADADRGACGWRRQHGQCGQQRDEPA